MSKPKIEAMYISPELSEILRKEPWLKSLIEQHEVEIQGSNVVINVPGLDSEHPLPHNYLDHGWYMKGTNIDEWLTNPSPKGKVYYMYSNHWITNSYDPTYNYSISSNSFASNVVWGIQVYDGTNVPIKPFYLQPPFWITVSCFCFFLHVLIRLIINCKPSKIENHGNEF